MSEWWTYSLSDFLMFSPRTYYRLLQMYNAALWPAHVLGVGAGVAILVGARRGPPAGSRVVAGLLCVAWAWVAWGFLWQRYATINSAATWMATAFAAQAFLFAALALRREAHVGATRAHGIAQRIGFALTAVGVLAYPFVAVIAGRDVSTSEVFGLAPDPTVLATLGVALWAWHRPRLVLLPVPLAWCAVSGATLWTMGSPEWWLLPAAAVLSIAAAVRDRQGA